MAAIGMRFTITLELSQEEYRLVEAAMNRQLRGDDVAKAKYLAGKWNEERSSLAKILTAAAPVTVGDGESKTPPPPTVVKEDSEV